MAKNKKTKTAAAEATQGAQNEQKIPQGPPGQEPVPTALDAPQEGAATQEIIGPDDPEGLLGCQDETVLAEGVLQSYAVTAEGGLRIRAEPTLNAPVAAVLPFGAGVFGDGEPGPDGWLHVFTGRLSGWMLAKHLEPFPVMDLDYGTE